MESVEAVSHLEGTLDPSVKTLTRYSEMVAVEATQRQILRRPKPYNPQELLEISRTGGLVLGGFLGDNLV